MTKELEQVQVEEEVEQVEEAVEVTEAEEIEVEETEEAEEIEEEQPKLKDDTVPLAKYMSEKKKRQEMERIFAQQRAEQEKAQMVQELVNVGYPEHEAIRQAEEKVRLQQDLRQVKEKQLEYEIRDLATSDTFYADAVSFKSELKEIMASKNVDAEEAYMLLRGKSRIREIALQNEQRNLASKKPGKKVESASPAPSKNPYPLTNDDKKALAGLQKAQPDTGWTAKKFYELMYPQ